MFEKISQSAETLVSRVSLSRRGFLGRTAKVAAGVGPALAGLVAFPTETEARGPRRTNGARGSTSSNCGCAAGQTLWCMYRPFPQDHVWVQYGRAVGCNCPQLILLYPSGVELFP